MCNCSYVPYFSTSRSVHEYPWLWKLQEPELRLQKWALGCLHAAKLCLLLFCCAYTVVLNFRMCVWFMFGKVFPRKSFFFHGEKVKQQIWVKANEVNWTSLSLFSCETIFKARLRFSWPSIFFLDFFVQKYYKCHTRKYQNIHVYGKKAFRTTRLKFTVSCLAAQHLEFLKNFHVE